MAGTNADFYSLVQRRIWNDAGFRALSKPSPNARDLFLYLLTSPHATQIPGLIAIGESTMAEDLGWPVAGLCKCLAELETAEMVKVDRAARLLWLPNGLKHNHPKSPDNVLGWAKHWRMLPECSLLREAAEFLMAAFVARGEPFAKAFARTSGLPDPVPMAPPEGPPQPQPKPNPMGTPEGHPPPRHQTQESESQSDQEIPDPPYPPKGGGGSVSQKKPARKRQAALPGIGDAADEVFAAFLGGWHRVVGKGGPPVLDDKRRRRVENWIAQGQTVDRLKAAAAGIFDSDWHVTPENRTHLTFEVALRDGGQIDKFSALFSAAEAQRATARSALPAPAWLNQRPPPRRGLLREVEAMNAAERAGDPFADIEGSMVVAPEVTADA